MRNWEFLYRKCSENQDCTQLPLSLTLRVKTDNLFDIRLAHGFLTQNKSASESPGGTSKPQVLTVNYPTDCRFLRRRASRRVKLQLEERGKCT
jgi:hypothetical protein